MRIRADFSQNVIVTPDQYQWLASPTMGVERMMLDRIGAEQARATSIVRYAAGSHFPAHAHPLGEEIFVLSGTFSDEEQDYAAGCYLRNPPGSRHAPRSEDGALIFVKLQQMRTDEREAVRVNSRDEKRWQQQGTAQVCELFHDGIERVRLIRLPAHQSLQVKDGGGAELLLLWGAAELERISYPAGTWMRFASNQPFTLRAGASGMQLYLKTGHLPSAAA